MPGDDLTMKNTRESFRAKWTNNPVLFFEETLREGSDTQQWLLTRNGFGSLAELRAHLADRRRLLDAGCGNGRVTALLRSLTSPEHTEIVAVDAVSADVARRNLADLPNITVAPADLLGDLRSLGEFDFIYCQEVLHHTGDPRAAFANVAHRLAPGGELAVYLYRQKAPVREFVDDFVRDHIGGMSYTDAMAVSRQITALGRALSDVPGTVRVPAVDVLGIEAGEYTVQRFLYHFFIKCYWNDDVSEEENVVVNYDWYHPQDCSRHTLPEVLEWFHVAGLTVEHQYQDPYGITIRGRRAHAD